MLMRDAIVDSGASYTYFPSFVELENERAGVGAVAVASLKPPRTRDTHVTQTRHKPGEDWVCFFDLLHCNGCGGAV